MTRASIDFFARGADAAENAVSLRRVGLRAGDVGAIWAIGGPDLPDPAAAQAIERRIETIDLGRVGLSGWPGHGIATENGTLVSSTRLAEIIAPAAPSAETLSRVLQTLKAGGGIVIVRAEDVPVGP